jgi:hypothetical protein
MLRNREAALREKIGILGQYDKRIRAARWPNGWNS